MARVDLQCGCGHMFFVGDAQFKAPGGVKCPACLEPVKPPPGLATAAKAAPKTPARAPAPAPAQDLDDDEPSAAVVPAAAAPDRKKLYLIGGVVGGVVLIALVTLVIVLMSSGVDYEKQARLAEEARRRQFEEISSGGKESKPSAPVGAKPVLPASPAAAPVKPRSTEYKPLPSNTPPSGAPATPAPAAPATPAPAQPGQAPAAAAPVNAEMVGRLKSDILGLHPFYLSLVLAPGEKARLDGIAASGRGLPDDGDFIQSVLTGARLKAVRDEVALIGQTLPTLERESQENLPVDRLTLVESGRVMNCRILEETPEMVKVARMLSGGVGGQLPIRRDAIRSIEKGKGIGAEFTAKWETAQKGTVAAQVEVMSWCKDNTLFGQAKLVAFTILRADPSNTVARTEAGLPADPVKYAEELAKGGFINYQGKNWAPKQLRDKFVSDGYTLVDGKWYSKKDKMITVPGLFRYEKQSDKPVNFTGTAQMCHETETVYKLVPDPTGQMTEQADTRYLRRFYSPELRIGQTSTVPPGMVIPSGTPELDIRAQIDIGQPAAGTKMTGEVVINVPVGATILEASVTTTAEVKAGGSIVVYFVHNLGTGDGEKRTKLYACDSKENQSHAIPPELVRGSQEVTLVAVIEQTAAYSTKVERRKVRTAQYNGKALRYPGMDIVHHRVTPEYKAVLFPSNNNTIEVFRLRATIAESAPTLDKLFAANQDALK